MKMKKLYIIAMTVIGMMFGGCNDFLEENVRGQENLDTYFQNADEAEAFIMGCYGSITEYTWWKIERMWVLSDMCTDDYWMGNTSQPQEEYISLAHYQGVGQSNGSISDFWQYRYKGILRCNIALDRIPNVDMDANLKKRLIAEAKFLRGYFYFDLVKNFGGVPLVTSFVMPHEVEGLTRSSLEECYAFIERDFSEAAADLPNRVSLSASDAGRATKGAALGFLGKVQVYNSEFPDAVNTLKEIISSNQYALMPDFGQVWNVDYKNNQESLFEVQNIYDETYALGGNIPMISGNRNSGDLDGWGWGVPTANLEAAYKAAGDTERLRWTIIKNGDKSIAGEPNLAELVAKQGDRNHDGSYHIDASSNKSQRLSRKHYLPFAKRPAKFGQESLSPLNYILLRYADILLLYAEACNETGNDAAAREALYEVRKRVGLGKVESSGTELRDAIRLERRLELATEAQRLYDIRRWTDSNGKKMVCNLMGPSGSFVMWNTGSMADPIELANQNEASNKGATFQEDRDLVFPIPLYEVTMSEGRIQQNPGWH